MSTPRQCLELFLTFAKVGAFTFGGGYAMLPILQREVVEKRHWATEDDLSDYFAIGQCTPGIIAVNTATFIGSRRCGVAGGVAATLGVVFPSFVIIVAIAATLRNFAEYPVVGHAFNGIRACVCVLILNAVIKLAKSGIVDMPAAVIFAVVFLISAIFGLTPAVLVVVSGLAGFAIRRVQNRRAGSAGQGSVAASTSVHGEGATSREAAEMPADAAEAPADGEGRP